MNILLTYKHYYKLPGDYPSFGSVMQGRAYSSGAYRFGFNGQEVVNELSDAYSFYFRIYRPQLGRFLSTDPLESDYPWNSNYAFAENRTIDGIDLEGLEYYNKTESGQVWIYYAEPKQPEKDCPTCMWESKGKPFDIGKTQIWTVNFTKNDNNEYSAKMVGTKYTTDPKETILKLNTATSLNTGGKVTLTKFSKQENEKLQYGTMSGVKINVNYKSSNPKVEGIYYLQSIPGSDGKTTYDASNNSPFYFESELGGKSNFEDNPSFNGNNYKNQTETFSATLVIYEKIGNEYTAVAALEYSYKVTFDSNGKGEVSNMKQKLTDLTVKK